MAAGAWLHAQIVTHPEAWGVLEPSGDRCKMAFAHEQALAPRPTVAQQATLEGGVLGRREPMSLEQGGYTMPTRALAGKRPLGSHDNRHKVLAFKRGVGSAQHIELISRRRHLE